LARAGVRVLLVDLDPQAHLSLHFGIELSEEQPSVYDVLTSSLPVKEAVIRVHGGVAVLPADIDLAGAEAELVSVTGREVLLRESLEPIQGEHEFLLIDCPPSLGVLTINALAAADEVLIPLQPHFLALQGLGKLLNTVTLVRQRINPRLQVRGIVLCMYEPSTRLAGEVVDDLKGFLEKARGMDVPWSGARLYETRIRRNIKLAESSSFGQTVFDYAPRSHGAADYARLAEEIFDVRVACPDAGGADGVTRAPQSAANEHGDGQPFSPAIGPITGSPAGESDGKGHLPDDPAMTMPVARGIEPALSPVNSAAVGV
jgi:chromosome partitioning protein